MEQKWCKISEKFNNANSHYQFHVAIYIDDTPVQRELDEVNHRYTDLRKHLVDCLDDLHVAERCNEETDNAQDTLDWVQAMNTKLDQTKPKSREIEPLREEIKAFKVCLCLLTSR